MLAGPGRGSKSPRESVAHCCKRANPATHALSSARRNRLTAAAPCRITPSNAFPHVNAHPSSSPAGGNRVDRYGGARIRAFDPASVAYTLRGGLQTHQVALTKPPSLKPGSLNLSWKEGSRRGYRINTHEKRAFHRIQTISNIVCTGWVVRPGSIAVRTCSKCELKCDADQLEKFLQVSTSVEGQHVQYFPE